MNSPYAYIVEMNGTIQAVFTWPNCARKYLRDVYTVDGVLRLPPVEHITLTRHKVNPKDGRVALAARLDIGAFLDA